jgi:hypothetical protein
VPRRLPPFAPLALLLAACAGPDAGEPGELELIEVAPSRTSVLTTDYDVAAAPQSRTAFSGVLPSDFPDDLPLYDPSTLTDFGGEGGGRYVILFTPDATTMVRDRMRGELARSGWTLIDGDTESGTWRRGSHSVIMYISDARPGTEIRVEY